MTMEISISKGRSIALVDDEDFGFISAFNWWLNDGYAVTQISQMRQGPQRKLTISMQRMIIDPPPWLEVDHRNRVKLDNRRSNLRHATRVQQMANQAPRCTNSSGYKGVRRSSRPRAKGWEALISIGGRSVSLGSYYSKEEAARAYDAAAFKAWGEFAYLNLPKVAS